MPDEAQYGSGFLWRESRLVYPWAGEGFTSIVETRRHMIFMDHEFRHGGDRHETFVYSPRRSFCQSTVLLAGIVLAGCNGQDGIAGRERLSQVLASVFEIVARC